ncbi:uncharacterized protein LOC143026440 isoform X2 [Oratosquilla oratoria]|uniref:uncharacterized protein LOC143026440 isoform X2 n=1 Tax=Oratosquilla oratoria TaxID=337810 RepID=UPI003F75F083
MMTSRARALRQRWATSKRSLSDSCREPPQAAYGRPNYQCPGGCQGHGCSLCINPPEPVHAAYNASFTPCESTGGGYSSSQGGSNSGSAVASGSNTPVLYENVNCVVCGRAARHEPCGACGGGGFASMSGGGGGGGGGLETHHGCSSPPPHESLLGALAGRVYSLLDLSPDVSRFPWKTDVGVQVDAQVDVHASASASSGQDHLSTAGGEPELSHAQEVSRSKKYLERQRSERNSLDKTKSEFGFYEQGRENRGAGGAFASASELTSSGSRSDGRTQHQQDQEKYYHYQQQQEQQQEKYYHQQQQQQRQEPQQERRRGSSGAAPGGAGVRAPCVVKVEGCEVSTDTSPLLLPSPTAPTSLTPPSTRTGSPGSRSGGGRYYGLSRHQPPYTSMCKSESMANPGSTSPGSLDGSPPPGDAPSLMAMKRDSTSFDQDELKSRLEELPSHLPRRESRTGLFNGLYTSISNTTKLRLVHQLSMDESRSDVYAELAALTTKDLKDAPPLPYTADLTPLKTSEKRRCFFQRKQTNSAPDSFDGNPQCKPRDRHSVSFCLDSALKPATLLPWNISEEDLLQVEQPGLVRGRDGGRGGAGYMNLPSPNVQADDGESELFGKEGAAESDSDTGEDPAGPPASALTARRRALVPPKLLPDAPSPFEETDPDNTRAFNGDGSTPRNKRRSSIVVIPPMQICPGDLLVYSKVLTHRTNLLAGDLDGSTQSLAATETACDCIADPVGSRKGKNTWSLLRIFERSSRGKSESLCGLEEVLSCLQPSEFEDEQLSRFKGMCWTDFVGFIDSTKSSQQRGQEGVADTQPLLALNDKPLLEDPKDTAGDLPSCSSSPSCRSVSPNLLSSSEPEEKLSMVHKAQRSSENVTTLNRVEREFPLTRRRHPLTIMRTMSERSLDRGRAGQLLNLLSERVHPENTQIKPSPLIHNMTEKNLGGLAGVERLLENARENVRAAINKNEVKRREAVWDLFQSECAFLYDHLMVLKNVYMEPLKKIQVDGYAMFAEPELLFGNLDELCCVTYAFCKEFITLLEKHQGFGGQLDTTKVLVNLFQKGSKATMLCQAYHRYALNYINALNYLETLRRQLEFCEFEKWCNRDPRCKKLQLTDLLVAPVQHIMKVPLILRDIEGRTEDPIEKSAVKEIIEAEENSLRELDDKMKWLKNFERLLEIQRNISWPPVTDLDNKVYIPEFLKSALSRQPCERLIVSPRRQIIMEGSLHLMDHSKPQEMYVILFDDMLLITRRKKGLHKKKSSLTENWPSSCSRATGSGESALRYIVYKQPLSLDRFFIHDVTPHESSTSKLESAFVLIILNRFQQIVAVYTFQAQTEHVKMTWLLKLRDTQDKWKSTLQNTVFRNQRLTSSTSGTLPSK